MHKIMITGNAGSGKTTLSYNLAEMLNRQDLINLDKIVWKSEWKLTDKAEKDFKLAEIAKMQTWIVDGVSTTLLEAADTIIFLDFPRHICYWRAFKRNCKYLFKSRPELPEKCPEILIVGKLIKIIWNFPKLDKPSILKQLNENSQKRCFHIHNDTELGLIMDEIGLGKM